jgi:hypothetical protein
MADTLKGSCLCGSVAYEVKDPQAMGYCHCTRCQRWTGSHLAGVVVAKENFTLTDGDDVIETYESEFAPRNFCGNCGSAIYDDLGADYFVAAGLMRDLDRGRRATAPPRGAPPPTTDQLSPPGGGQVINRRSDRSGPEGLGGPGAGDHGVGIDGAEVGPVGGEGLESSRERELGEERRQVRRRGKAGHRDALVLGGAGDLGGEAG